MIYPRRIALAALLVILPCAAQTPAELLQKGIYTQETTGDLDGALQIYRQIVASAPAQSPVAAQAQFRIAETLLQKGDLNAAALEFNILATRYSDQQALIAKMAARLRAGGVSRVPTGTILNGRYHNKRTGLEFAVPANWKPTYDGPSSDNGDMVGLSDGSAVDYGVWMIPEASTASEIPQKLKNAVPAKARATSFTFRPESIQPRTIGGQQALTAVADYVQNGWKMAAAYIWIYTAKTHVVFLARQIPVDDLAAVQARLEQLAVTALVP